MKRALATIACLAALATPGAAARAALTEVSSMRIERCQEDMPCWDCSTMGNRICGPGLGLELVLPETL